VGGGKNFLGQPKKKGRGKKANARGGLDGGRGGANSFYHTTYRGRLERAGGSLDVKKTPVKMETRSSQWRGCFTGHCERGVKSEVNGGRKYLPF